jgi:hypothetical protein
MLPKLLSVSFVGLLLLTFSASAGTSAFEGVVKDPTGRPIKGADVHIEAKNGSNFSTIAKTDATGHYTSDGLAAGTYKVSLVVDGSVKASILQARAQLGKRTRLNFELTQKTGPVKKHMVWIPAEIGTRIGHGQWVEIDDEGNVVAHSGVSSVERTNASALSKMTNRPRSPQGN